MFLNPLPGNQAKDVGGTVTALRESSTDDGDVPVDRNRRPERVTCRETCGYNFLYFFVLRADASVRINRAGTHSNCIMVLGANEQLIAVYRRGKAENISEDSIGRGQFAFAV
ncbi:MAG: hypothetical protein ABGW98_17315, partial [Myxococcales bacterium]